MLDPDVSPIARGSGVPMDYRNKADPATQSLRDRIAQEIGTTGPMPLPRYLERALYDPELGYYAQGGHHVGQAGDFFTSVSVGPLFGTLLARRFARHYREIGTPDHWRIRELGANDGRLAADVLKALTATDPQALAALEYQILEPLPRLRDTQRSLLAPFAEHVQIIDPAENQPIDHLPGLVFGNEVLDALPFHWLQWRSGTWQEILITVGENGSLQPTLAGEPSSDLLNWINQATHDLSLPDGWQCEVRMQWRNFLESSLHGLTNPLAIWIDYGFPRQDLLLPHRTEGTWRAYRNHKVEPAPWDYPGECDLTAHVDFTGVAEAIESLGGRVTRLTSQGTWLTHLAIDDLTAREGSPDPTWTRQFQTLTHPAHLGSKFHVLECIWK